MADFVTRHGRLRPAAAATVSLLAVGAVMASGVPLMAKFVLVPVIVMAALRVVARPQRHAVRLDRFAGSSLDGVRGQLAGEATNGLFLALRLTTPDGQRKRVFVFRDELEPDAFRALLAYLRHG